MSTSVTPAAFAFLRTFVRERSAIQLVAGKEYLVECRLSPLVRAGGLKDLDELVEEVRANPNGELGVKVLEAMTTNETSFFRDVHPFDALRSHVIPDLINARQAERRLNIWCAASSSGQEPYTIAMVLKEHFPELAGWGVQICATDISSAMLSRVRAGRYSQLEVNRGLPARYLARWFKKEGLDWVAQPEVREMVKPMFLNLARPWPALPSFDLVFIRNVLIYFDVETKRSILAKIRGVMRADGFLFLGGAETTMGIDENYARLGVGKSWCYRLVDCPAPVLPKGPPLKREAQR